jgi:regulator of replication initiation timing
MAEIFDQLSELSETLNHLPRHIAFAKLQAMAEAKKIMAA